MDIKNSIDFRDSRYAQYNNTGRIPYNYEKNGILTKCLPRILFKGNSIFVSFIQLIDMKCIMLFKYIDKLKHFKHITYYN